MHMSNSWLDSCVILAHVFDVGLLNVLLSIPIRHSLLMVDIEKEFEHPIQNLKGNGGVYLDL